MKRGRGRPIGSTKPLSEHGSYKSAKHQARKRQIAEAAVSCVADHGETGTTLEKIGEGAGLSRGGLENYFIFGRPEILAAARELAAARLNSAPIEPSWLSERIIEIISDPYCRALWRLDPTNRAIHFGPRLRKTWENGTIEDPSTLSDCVALDIYLLAALLADDSGPPLNLDLQRLIVSHAVARRLFIDRT